MILKTCITESLKVRPTWIMTNRYQDAIFFCTYHKWISGVCVCVPLENSFSNLLIKISAVTLSLEVAVAITELLIIILSQVDQRNRLLVNLILSFFAFEFELQLPTFSWKLLSNFWWFFCSTILSVWWINVLYCNPVSNWMETNYSFRLFLMAVYFSR